MTQTPSAPAPEISVVVPVYNSETTLEGLTVRIFAVLDGIGKGGRSSLSMTAA